MERCIRIARLAHHPSLAIWNGCNENIWAYRDWGWKESDEVKGHTWGKNFYFDLLPRVCKELTPGIPYWAGSPWSGDYDVDNGIHPNAATHGNKHVWEAWFRERAPDDLARFEAYRRCGGKGMAAQAKSEALLAAAPHVSAFLAKLFGVEAEVSALAAAVKAGDPVFRFKHEFVKKRILKDAGKAWASWFSQTSLPPYTSSPRSSPSTLPSASAST